jgi:hypothetical protein
MRGYRLRPTSAMEDGAAYEAARPREWYTTGGPSEWEARVFSVPWKTGLSYATSTTPVFTTRENTCCLTTGEW